MISLQEFDETPLPVSEFSLSSSRTFAREGWLESALGLEHRPQQAAMARAVADAFETDNSLLFEAGTGVGKSLAYLIPGVLLASETGRRFIVSTHTRALQEQIRGKDLAIVRSLMKQIPELKRQADFRVAKLVGRSNYLCTTRLAQALSTRAELFPTEQQQELEAIVRWSTTTEEGLFEEIQPQPSSEVWDWVNADSSVCNRKNCEGSDCFYRKALRQREDAHVLILNHSLLFSLLQAGLNPGDDTPGILFPNDFAVLDEAHRVPEIATEHFGLSLSSYGLNRVLKSLYSERGGKARGLLVRLNAKQDFRLVAQASEASEGFFQLIRRTFLDNANLARLHQPDWAGAEFMQPLDRLTGALGTLAAEQTQPTLKDEIADQRQRLLGYRNGILEALGLKKDDHVYWVEGSGRRGQHVALRSAPLDVAPYLRKSLFARDTSAVLTSATLATGMTMESFQRDTGSESARTGQVTSPFDYESNLQVFLSEDAPAPDLNKQGLDADYLADMVRFCCLRCEGGTLVLFTSYADLQRTARRLEQEFGLEGRTLLCQGRERSRNELLESFKASGNGILFGTDSFWTGVDVPGPALSQVIITRLPFRNPTHPVSSAKSEWLRIQGRNPFTEMTLPEAVIQFRQGIGRLIRTVDDSGWVTILDSRIGKRPYGRVFLASLPIQRWTGFTRSNRDTVFPLA